MNERDIEKLLQRLEGPAPRPETTRAVMELARKSAAPSTTAAMHSVKARAFRARLRWAVAALVLISVATGVGVWLRGGKTVLATVASDALQVRRDGQALTLNREAPLYAGDEIAAETESDILLKDQSTVRIDTGTLLRLDPPRKGERARLALEKGRVFLSVSPAEGAFLVSASAEVRVVGTRFGVVEDNGLTSVHVLSGRVALQSAGAELTLERGRSGEARKDNAPVETAADPDDALLWARDMIFFENRPLGEVLDWLADNSSYRFEASEDLRARIQVSVAVGDEPIPDIVRALALTCGLRHEFDGHDVTITE